MTKRIRFNGKLYEAVSETGLTQKQLEELGELRKTASYVFAYLREYGIQLDKVKKWLKPGDIKTYDGKDDLLDVIDVDAFRRGLTFDHIEYILNQVTE